MFKNAVQLFEIFGFKLKVDPSWLLIATLIVWSLSTSYFPGVLPGRTSTIYTVLGIIAMLGMFASLILHELAHSVVARSYGLKVGGITLFIFGGVAELEEEPHDPKSEFQIAIAGPLMSLFLAGLFYGVSNLLAGGSEISPAGAVVGYLALINLVLAVFNLIPAFPLDGGRMLRAAIWRVTQDLLRATMISSRIGSAFALFLMLTGALALFAGGGIGGFWQILIGFFILNASNGSYQNLLVKTALRGKTASSLMSDLVHTIDAEASIADLVDTVMLRHGVSFVPVVSNDILIGYADTAGVRSVDRQDWATRNVAGIMIRRDPSNTVAPQMPLNEVFECLTSHPRRKLMVAQGQRLAGVISLSDLMHHLALEQELGAKPARHT
ncbi:MAG: site-2 protease family protein [Hoeflea sp.]|uniref:site-2 protease family protein n=1 Tax=Hoeflea sp. TaxID=1940281 RepID=UPI001DF6AD88|nr:site-2 protease family protein [Hoeflea sp.]MBU4527367.1 site-2 protease family protein [Alphaproteobacteria bacterium]MBU4546850.1 site-2 protease family protein [Alphaproteobacteria bacterium]MBU4551638.1 site-2 protease family protein [Alphaproteobacteria bacterium]MBV1725643.1 site-2 protease family protein [Hoeflea sp.]MBV1759691.1 site-2 protease family protein [Hoeflea sp.]